MEIHLRGDEGFTELTKRSETLSEGLREIASLCVGVAEDLESKANE